MNTEADNLRASNKFKKRSVIQDTVTGEIRNWDQFYDMLNIGQQKDCNEDNNNNTITMSTSLVQEATKAYTGKTKLQYIVMEDNARDQSEENKGNTIDLHNVETGETIKITVKEYQRL